MVVGILGLGQVGKSIKELCKNKYHVVCRDTTFDEFASVKKIKILHVCIPYSNQFENVVLRTIKSFQPKLVIINSSVVPGASASIYRQTKVYLVHAPVLGKHPNLAKYHKIFKKPIGAVNEESFKEANMHFTRLGVKIVRFRGPLDTELAKLLDTTYYAWNILFEKWIWNICKMAGANFEEVYSEFNRIYNDGYKNEVPSVRRPILQHKPGPIGGHCVIPNLAILKGWLKTQSPELAKWIEFMEEKNKDMV